MEEKSDYKNRRTFAIISHPDAGKTTLTEKLLLYGNAIDLAGNVRARRNQRTTTSDWMEMERERGISIILNRAAVPLPGADHQLARHARATRISPKTPTAP